MKLDQLKGETVQVEMVNHLEIVGKFVELKDDEFHLSNAFKVVPVRFIDKDEEGNPVEKMGANWVPFGEKDVFLYKHAVIMRPVKCNDKIAQIYLQHTSNLTIPKAEEIQKFKMSRNN